MTTPERPADDPNRTERGQARGGVRGVLNELLHGRDDTDQRAGEPRTEQLGPDGRPVRTEAQPIPGAPGYRDPAGPQHAAAPPQQGRPADGVPAGGVPAGGGAPAGGVPAGGAPAGRVPAQGVPAGGATAGGSTLPPAPGPQGAGQHGAGQQVSGSAPDQSYGGSQVAGRPGSESAGAGPGAAGAAGAGAGGIAAAGATHAAGTTDRRERADTGRPVGEPDPTQQPTAQHGSDQQVAAQRGQHAAPQHATDEHGTGRPAAGQAGAAGAGTPAGPSAGEDAAGLERLVPTARAQEYGARWDAVKGTFVDEPRKAVQQADVLVGELLEELEQLFRDQRRGLEQGLDADETSTEDLRLALRRYRSFFDRLLSL